VLNSALRFENLKFVAAARAVYGNSTGVILSTVGACTMKGSGARIGRDRRLYAAYAPRANLEQAIAEFDKLPAIDARAAHAPGGPLTLAQLNHPARRI